MAISVRQATFPQDLETARTLLREYAGYLNESLGEEHICLAEYERELETLPGAYAGPGGTILLAYDNALEGEGGEVGETSVGCVALKAVKPLRAARAGMDSRESACEMKRLWVRPEARGQSVGLLLAEALIAFARRREYTAMYLDTVPMAMRSANRIYQKLGFRAVERYNTNPILGLNPLVAVEFFRLPLS